MGLHIDNLLIVFQQFPQFGKPADPRQTQPKVFNQMQNKQKADSILWK